MVSAIINHPSPNHDERGQAITMVVLHYTGMKTGAEALARLCDPSVEVSAHYLVEEDGRTFQLVPEERRAWHAGQSCWQGEAGTNACSIGIEIVNPGHEWGYRAFPGAQIDAVMALLKAIMQRWSIPAYRVLAHSDVAPGRKEDPGELFPWGRLAAAGLAIAPYRGKPDETITYQDALNLLPMIGYEVRDGAHVAALLAFQRRFCPDELGKGFSATTKAALRYAAKEMNV